MPVGPASHLPPDSGGETYRFGPYLLEPRERRLLRDGQPIELRPKAFDALVLLVTSAGRLVSKEDFFASLWPRVVVGDASLNKCIWQLRQALGDDDARYIETVPKIGYRFAAAVERERTATPDTGSPALQPSSAVAAGGGPRQEPSAPRLPTQPTKRRWPWIAVVAITVAALLLLQIPQRRESAPPATPAGATRVLAIAGIEDLNPHADTAWLGTALLELAAVQFAGVDSLRVTAAETLRDFGFDPVSTARASPLKLPAAIRADWRLSGSYVTVAASGLPREVQLTLTVVDADRGEELAQASRRGLESDLFELMSAAGAELRQELGLTNPRESAYTDERSVVPSEPAALQAYAAGLAALRRFDLLAAVKQFQEVVALTPDFAPAHAALAQSWSLLGYERRAREAMAAAERLATPLPRALKLAYAAQAAEMRGEWPEAIKNYEALSTLYPEDPDYALRLATAQIRSGANADGRATLDLLIRQMPASAEDPRVLYTRARGLYMQGSNAEALTDTERARALAERAQAPLLAAEAAVHQGWTLQMLGRTEDSEAAYGYSRDTFANAGHTVNAARAAFQLLQLRFGYVGSYASLQPEIESLLALARSAGSRRVESSVLSTLANLYWTSKQYDKGHETLRQLLALERELGNRNGEGRAHIMLATVETSTGATDAALAEFEQAETLLREIDDPSTLSWALTLHADLERKRARFARAEELLDAAGAAAARTDEQSQIGDVEYHRAILALDRHALDEGDALIEQAAGRARAADHTERIGLVAGVQAEFAMARGHTEDAWKAISTNLAIDDELGRAGDNAWSAAFAARIQIARGNLEAARQLVATATAQLPALSSSITGLTTRLYLADDHWLLGETEPARALWRHVEQDAGRRGLAMIQLEARIGLACEDPAVLAASLQEARALGFERAVHWATVHCGAAGEAVRATR